VLRPVDRYETGRLHRQAAGQAAGQAACLWLDSNALLTLCAARRLHLAKFERAVLGLLLASNALAVSPAADSPVQEAGPVSIHARTLALIH